MAGIVYVMGFFAACNFHIWAESWRPPFKNRDFNLGAGLFNVFIIVFAMWMAMWG
jgi:hypothetical protein